MDLVWIILGAALIIAGFVGSLLPVLPGLPLSYAGLLCLQLTQEPPFSLTFLLVWAGIVAVIMVLDNIIPAYGTKKSGGTSYGIWGSIFGLAIGIIFFPPLGMVIGPLIGAFAGELVGGQTSDRALKSALGSFAGLLVNTVIKVIASGIMGYYFIINI